MRRLLIANRGEIAVRIIRTAHELGIETVLTVSEPDRQSLGARLADEIAVVGPAQATKSYLNIDSVLGAATEHDCDAVHPGYGFLSENARFARAVIDKGLTWVGPSPESIELMGDKARAREAAKAAGVLTLAGTDGAVPEENSDEAFKAIAEQIGFPLVIKAAAGGGGRGIRLVREVAELVKTVSTARAEASAAFGDAAVYLERYIDHARHVEVQVLGDGSNAVHLGDRDCSMQRRQQKVIEEAPAPGLPDEVRQGIRSSAVHLARECHYSGVGTVEFLYDPSRHEAAFIEMNTRLQVEHPVTEMVTGMDLVREQLRIADGGSLERTQDDIELIGHAIEVRINAEDPNKNFMPSPGTLSAVDWPGGPGIRVDAGVADGAVIAPFYDSLVAKVIAWDATREQAIARLDRALTETRVDGIKTTIPLLVKLIKRPEFRDATHHTKFIESTPELFEDEPPAQATQDSQTRVKGDRT